MPRSFAFGTRDRFIDLVFEGWSFQAAGERQVQMPMQAAAAMRHHRDSVLKPIGAQPLRTQEPKERTQRHRRQLRPRLLAVRQRPDEVHDIAHTDSRGIDRAMHRNCARQGEN